MDMHRAKRRPSSGAKTGERIEEHHRVAPAGQRDGDAQGVGRPPRIASEQRGDDRREPPR